MKLMLRLEQHELYSTAKEWRSETLFTANQLPNPIQVEAPNTQEGPSKRERIGKSGRNIRENRGVVWTWNWWQLSFSVLVWAFLVVVMATVNCHGAGGCVIQHANVLQWAYNEAQGLPEVKSSSILGLAGSNQFLFFSLCSLLLKLR